MTDLVQFRFQMQHAHTADECLARVGMYLPTKRWILSRQRSECLLHLCPICSALGLDRHADDAFRECDCIEKDWMLWIAERVACNGLLGADDCNDVPGICGFKRFLVFRIS